MSLLVVLYKAMVVKRGLKDKATVVERGLKDTWSAVM